MAAVAAAYRAAVLRCVDTGDTLPTSLDVLSHLRRWSYVASREDVFEWCRECKYALADMPAPPAPSRARPVVL